VNGKKNQKGMLMQAVGAIVVLGVLIILYYFVMPLLAAEFQGANNYVSLVTPKEQNAVKRFETRYSTTAGAAFILGAVLISIYVVVAAQRREPDTYNV